MRHTIVVFVALSLLGTAAVATTANAGAPAGSAGYFVLERDYRECAAPFCGGWFVERPNRKLTRCADGTKQEQCYVADINWAAVGLSAAEQEALSRDGTLARSVLKGRIDVSDALFDLGVLTANGVWLAATETPATGRLRRIEDTGIVCITSPCPVFEGQRLNSRRVDEFDHLALRKVGAPNETRKAAEVAADSGELLVAGRVVRKPQIHILRATQFYLPIGPDGCTTTCDESSDCTPSCLPTP